MSRGYRISRITAPAESLALITLEQAKAALGIDPADTSQDAAITQQIDQVSAAIDNYCDRILVRQSYRDQFRFVCNWLLPGDPLRTRQYPIATDVDGASLLTVTEDGGVVDPAAWEVEIESGLVYKLNGSVAGSWTGNSIVVDYDGGYDPIPPDIQSAALQWLGARWAAQGRDPALRSETIPDVISQTWSDMGAAGGAAGSSIPGGVQDMLSAYRLWSV